MKFYNFGKYHRIDKRVARKMYNEGLDVVFIPCNMRPDSDWGLGIPQNKNNIGNDGTDFDKLVQLYQWYNCNAETGKYVAFYVEVK